MRLTSISIFATLLSCLLCTVPSLAVAEPPAVQPSLVGDDHVSEGVLLGMPDGRLVHVFRIDPGLSGGHVGNGGQLGVRKSVDGGLTWGQTERIDPSPYDDRNFSGFVRDGELEVAYRQYDAKSRTGLGLFWMNTVGSGWLWESTMLKLPLAAPGRTVIAPDGITHVPHRGWLAFMYNSFESSHYLLSSEDGAFWDFGTARRIPLPAELGFSESALAHIGGDRVLAVLRNERREPGYHAIRSDDAGESWSAPLRLPGHRYWSSAPHLLTDPSTESVYLLGGERIAADGNESNRACAIVVYRSTFDRLSADPTDWDYYGSVPRPWPSAYALYGYPSAAKRSDGTHLVVFTDRGRDPDGTEAANLFQFVLEDAEGNPPSASLAASMPATAAALSAFTVRGTVMDAHGDGLGGVQCQVQRRDATGQWVTLTTAQSRADGTWEATGAASVKSSWRVVTPAIDGGHTCGFGPMNITPVLTLSRPTVKTLVRVGQVYTVTGEITPVRTAGPVRLVVERKTSTGWKVSERGVARVIYKGAGRSVIKKSLVLPYRGSWRIRFEYAENASHGRSVSAVRYLTSR